MNRGICPCTALTLTRDNAGTLEACLRSGLFCAEHVILDGGSVDGTVSLAEKYGCRVVPQDRNFLNTEGRIMDYGNIRNQGIKEATYPWVMITDSDEYLDKESIKVMERIVEEESPGAYDVNRLYTYRGHVIKYASTYPNRQIRFFHKDAITKFIKIVHERPELRPGISVKILPGIQYVPLTPLPDLKQKFRRYLPLEAKLVGGEGWMNWFWLVFDKNLRLAVRFFRIIRDRLLHRWRDCLPLRYEFLYFWYAWAILWYTCPLVFKKKS
ncbi:glycosyltransferase family 2 protein [Candidatus Peregrinibacteria bacterium]|nr:glycosyltransferase family 2 protein [Candidatus Peregrinibacteria bacterium]